MRSRREHKSKIRRLLPWGGGIFFLLLLLVLRPPEMLQGAVHTVGEPFRFVARKVAEGFTGSITYFKSKHSLESENRSLRERVLLLEAENKTVTALRYANESLTDLLHKRTDEKRVLASVLLMPPQTPYDILRIDVGEEDGVSSGDQVFAYGDIGLGTIMDVGKNSSSVLLYSTPGRSTAGFLLLATSSVAVPVIGEGAGNFIIELPRGVPVATDTPVVLPGTRTTLLGTVGRVVERPTDAFETVLILSPISMRGLRVVEVAPKSGVAVEP